MKRTLAVIFFTIFIDLIGIGMVVPVLPQLFGNSSSPLYLLGSGNTVKLGLILNGFLFSIYAVGQFVASPLMGQLSDRVGRRKVLATAMFITAFAQAGFAFAISILSVFLLFVTRFIAGLASGNIPVAQAVITDTVPEEKRSSAMGVIGAAFGLGLIIGPYLGGKLMEISPTAPFWTAAALAFLNGFFLLFMLEETHEIEPVDPDAPVEKESLWRKLSFRAAFLDIHEAFTHPVLHSIYIVYFLMQLGFALFMSFATVHIMHRFNFSPDQLGVYAAFTGVCAVIAQVVVVRLLARRHTEQSTIAPGLALNAVGLLGIALARSVTMLYGSTFLLAVGYGLVYANAAALLSIRVEDDERGSVLGYLGSVMALGLAVPPLIAGFLAATFSAKGVIVLAAAIVFAGALYFRKVHGGSIILPEQKPRPRFKKNK